MAKTAGRHGGVTRRDVLVGLGAAAGATALTATGTAFLGGAQVGTENSANAASTVPFFGEHQAGIDTRTQANAVFVAYQLADDATIDDVRGVMRVATLEASRLCSGEPGMSDTDPTLATTPANLTITVGFGHGFFDKLGLTALKPTGFVKLPAFAIDELRPEFCGGDFLFQICSDDPLTLAHAQRHMTRVVSSILTPMYAQRGFSGAAGMTANDETHRNLFGFKDGTENPRTAESFDSQVWSGTEAGWCAGGTQLVIRRIAMKLQTWDRLGPGDKEDAIGRRMSSGAPLTGEREFDAPEFDARTKSGLLVIPEFSHIRRANSTDPKRRFLRRPFNYDEGFQSDGQPDVGLIFTAYTKNIERRYIPTQQKLAEMDLLNVWTTPIGSAEFVIPPGVPEGGYLGQQLLDA